MRNMMNMKNMKKLSVSLLTSLFTSFIISLSLSSLVIFLHQAMDYGVPLVLLFFLSLILLFSPDFRFLFSKRRVHLLFVSMTIIVYILPFFLIPFFDGNNFLTFYPDLYRDALRIFKGEKVIFRVSFQGVIICLFLCFGLLIKTLLLRFRKVTGFLLLGLQFTVLITVLILNRLPGLLSLALIFFTLLVNLMFFFYRKRVCLEKTKDQIIFFLQSFFYGIVFSLLLCGAFLTNSDPMNFLRGFSIDDTAVKFNRLINFNNDEGTVLMDEKAGTLGLASSFPNRKGTALILLSSKTVYLKSHILNSYNGREWRWSEVETPLPDPMTELSLLNRQDYFNSEEPVEIFYKEIISNSKIVPLFTLRTEDFFENQKPPYGNGTRYKAFYYTPSKYFWNELHSASSADVTNIDPNTMIDEIPDSVVDLATRITKNVDGAYSKARHLEDYLRHNYLYKTVPPEPPTEGDLTEFFLLESHEGFCIHFASALALLCRSVNIPSRIAVGYVAQNGQEMDNDSRLLFSVSHAEAHAWTEVYISPVGWIPMDGTPRFSRAYDSYLNDEEFIIQNTAIEQLEVNERVNILPGIVFVLIFCFTLIILWPLIAVLINKILYITPRQKAKKYYIHFIRLLKLYHYTYLPSRTLSEISEEFIRKENTEDKPESIRKFLKKLEEMIYRDNDFSIENLAILKKLYKQTQYFFFKKGKKYLFLLYKYLGFL